MIVTLAQKEDVLYIAQIHKAEIGKGFLSSLPTAFLTTFYRALTESQSSFCLVAKEGDKVIGFISGVSDMNAFYGYFLKHYFFQSFVILLPKVFSSAKKVLETLLYPKKESSLPKAELLTIAIANNFQCRGIGSLMLQPFIAEMKKREVKVFKVVVGQKLASAIKFYEKNTFTFLKNITIHGQDVSRVYLYIISK
ncbi:MAG: GNAT family N-acetyltransferase [Candidatus Staskawiczbacteria bacterium]|nr:GNAT family N-acetyltransferase [Candidatus Staskawiczbacteria bacterium]